MSWPGAPMPLHEAWGVCTGLRGRVAVCRAAVAGPDPRPGHRERRSAWRDSGCSSGGAGRPV